MGNLKEGVIMGYPVRGWGKGGGRQQGPPFCKVEVFRDNLSFIYGGGGGVYCTSFYISG